MALPINGKTKLICLLGSPVEHSLSPAMHNSAFAALDLDYRYLAFDIKSNELPDVIKAFREMNVKGFNLTMPLKKEIIPLIDELSPAAELSRSVNTVTNIDGHLYGDTTDGRGFLMALSESGFSYSGKSAVILGAGGASMSICTEAALTGLKKLCIFKRNNSSFSDTVSFAKRLNSETNCRVIVRSFDDSDQLENEISTADLLINATNVGMNQDISSLVPMKYLRKNLFVADLIYSPDMTTLLKDAKSTGALFMNGKYMLMYQGACSFKEWTSVDMPIDVIKPIFDQK